MLKTTGYLVSTISVLLLGFVSWRGASEDPVLLSCLIAGIITSVTGMFLRWLSYRDSRKQVRGAVIQLADAPSGGRNGGATQAESLTLSAQEL